MILMVLKKSPTTSFRSPEKQRFPENSLVCGVALTFRVFWDGWQTFGGRKSVDRKKETGEIIPVDKKADSGEIEEKL